MSLKIGLVIPTLNAGTGWGACVDAIKGQSLRFDRFLIVDSSSDDRTPELAREAGFDVVTIRRADFNHGGTRQWAVENLRDCEVIVFLTQDAVLATNTAIAALVGCFDDPEVAVAYGRQLPHSGATPIESHARLFNYGTQTIKKNTADAMRIGSKVFFCSNSFAAYRRAILVGLGGFRRDLILGEDMELAARAIKAGYGNVYCAEASVYHSHDYTMRQTLERYFDLGVFDRRNAWMHDEFGSFRGEGLRFIFSELRYLRKHAPAQIPRAFALTCAKLLGFRLGKAEGLLPKPFKRKLSMLPGYFR